LAEERLMRGFLGPLDRYILGDFLRTFAATALGFPLLVVVIDLTDNADKYLARQIPVDQLALSYLYYIPESLFMVLPAAVLFATVFTINGLTKHSEVTAAKASGISFYRLIFPLALGAAFATGLGLVVGELVPLGNTRRNEILGEKEARGLNQRYNFAYAAEGGRVYKIASANADSGVLRGIELERRGTGSAFPTVVTLANNAQYRAGQGWALRKGTVHVVPDDSTVHSVNFEVMLDREFTERPRDLLQNPKAPEEMRREDLGKFIAAMERSGVNVKSQRVERMLRIAIPVTCLIIFLFAAPLATSNQRGGAAFGIGIALATTVLFLMLVQLTKAVGKQGLVNPELAAWIPSLVFGIAGVWLLARVRT
jgi:lipopolysaccharide export system permease protein